MYRFPLCGERRRNNIFTTWNQCVSTRNKHLYNIYMFVVCLFFFNPFIVLSWRRGGLLCTERLFLFFLNRENYFTLFSVWEGETKTTFKSSWNFLDGRSQIVGEKKKQGGSETTCRSDWSEEDGEYQQRRSEAVRHAGAGIKRSTCRRFGSSEKLIRGKKHGIQICESKK